MQQYTPIEIDQAMLDGPKLVLDSVISETAMDKFTILDNTNSHSTPFADPELMEQFMQMRQRVGKHTIARRERAKSRISKRKNKR